MPDSVLSQFHNTLYVQPFFSLSLAGTGQLQKARVLIALWHILFITGIKAVL